MKTCVSAVAIIVATTGMSYSHDPAAGAGVFKRMCFPCHDAGSGAKVKLGPPLNGIDGRTAGTVVGFNYSDANKNSGIKWAAETFAEYIKNPMQRMPGTRMAFAGLRNEKDIADLWAFLKQFNAGGDRR